MESFEPPDLIRQSVPLVAEHGNALWKETITQRASHPNVSTLRGELMTRFIDIEGWVVLHRRSDVCHQL